MAKIAHPAHCMEIQEETGCGGASPKQRSSTRLASPASTAAAMIDHPAVRFTGYQTEGLLSVSAVRNPYQRLGGTRANANGRPITKKIAGIPAATVQCTIRVRIF